MWERMKDDESDAPCLTAVCLAHSAHITLLLFSHTGLREASHGHLEARRLATSQFIKNKQKTACLLRNQAVILQVQSLSLRFQQHYGGIITITRLESPICFISTSLCPTTGSCANPSLAARRRLSRYNPLSVEPDIEATLSDVLQVGSVCLAFPIKSYWSIWQHFVQHNLLRTVGAMLLGKR